MNHRVPVSKYFGIEITYLAISESATDPSRSLSHFFSFIKWKKEKLVVHQQEALGEEEGISTTAKFREMQKLALI